MSVLVLIECTEGEVKKSSLETATYGSQLAATLGTTAVAIAIGDISPEALAPLGSQGITKVYYNNEPQVKDFLPAAYAKIISKAFEAAQAQILILANSNIGTAVGSRLAVKLNASLATNVVAQPAITGNNFIVKRGVFSGKAFAEVNLTSDKK